MAVKVTVKEIEVRNDGIVIDNSDLKDLVQNDKDSAVDLLKSDADDVSADDVSIDDKGRVVITNAALAESFARKTFADSGTEPGNNLLCGYAC